MPGSSNPYETTRDCDPPQASRTPNAISYGFVAVFAMLVAFASAIVTYIVCALSSHGGDFSFMIAFGPAAFAFLAGGGVTFVAGLAYVFTNHG